MASDKNNMLKLVLKNEHFQSVVRRNYDPNDKHDALVFKYEQLLKQYEELTKHNNDLKATNNLLHDENNTLNEVIEGNNLSQYLETVKRNNEFKRLLKLYNTENNQLHELRKSQNQIILALKAFITGGLDENSSRIVMEFLSDNRAEALFANEQKYNASGQVNYPQVIVNPEDGYDEID